MDDINSVSESPEEDFVNVSSSKSTFSESCIQALHYLMSNYYSLQLEKQNKVMDTLMKQLGNGFITVSFIGEYNSGKSTLINALLGNSYLHEDFKAATINQVYVEHDLNVHFNNCCEKNKITCEACPKLTTFPPKDDSSFLAVGRLNILEIIKRSNSEHRRSGMRSHQLDVGDYLLRVNSPFLEDISRRSRMKVYLVDTPGFGETNKQAEQAALAAMASSSVYVLCMDYEHTEGTKQREFIKNHLTKSEDGCSYARLLICITKCDRLSDQADCTDAYASLKQSVCEELNGFLKSTEDNEGESCSGGVCATGCPPAAPAHVLTVPLAHIIPVSAQCEKRAAECDGAAEKGSSQATVELNCQRAIMKRRSNVETLRLMIRHAVEKSHDCWVEQMKQGVTEVLSCALKTLCQATKDTKSQLIKLNLDIGELSMSRSAFYFGFDINPHKERIRASYKEDIKSILDALHQQLDTFGEVSCTKVELGTYKKGEFKQDVSDFLEGFSIMANAKMDTVSFDAMYSRYTNACCAVQQWYTQRINAAIHFCTGTTNSTDEDGSDLEYQVTLKLGTVRAAPNFVELKDQLDIPPIELKWFEKVQEYFRKHFPGIFNVDGMPLEYYHLLRSSHVETFVKDLQNLVEQKCSENDKVVEHFFESLKMVYESKCQQLHHRWGERVKEKEKYLEMLGNERLSAEMKVEQLRLCTDRINAHMEDIEKKAKLALQVTLNPQKCS